MRFVILLVLLLTSVVTQKLTAQTLGGLNQATAVGPFLNGSLPPRTPRPSTGGWRLVNAFPGLTFIDPVQMIPVPYSNRLLVLEKAGRLVVFDNNETATSKTVLFDIRSQVESQHDSGMVGLALHPDFGVAGSPNRHYLYVFYRYTPQKSDTNRAYCRLSRFTWDPATSTIAPASEFILINQYDRHNWHNGGGLFFGTDRFLYLSIGDEGGANDQYDTGQKRNVGLLAGVLRIDVDRDPTRSHAIRRQPLNPTTPPAGWPNSYSQGYFVPNDNPWQSPDGSQLEEFYAVGTRSPHRMTQDPVTGDIWLGDVGQGTQEEVTKVFRGGNLQWPYREGTAAGPKAKPSPLIGFDVAPVHAYGRGSGTCVIGGYVYRGALHPELTGKYIFGDHGSGRIWSLDDSSGTAVVTSLLTMASHGPGPKNGMGSFGLDASGEIYVLSLAGTNLDGGRIYRLEKTTEGVPEPPRLLSQTTAFTNLATLAPAPGVMPYDVIQPLWSDDSDKRRWIALPNDGNPNTAAERIAWSEEGNWTFPVGTVLIKHFEVPGRRLETRFFVNGDDGTWFGFTYRWRPDGSDAELLPGEPVVETFTANGTTRTWHFPGRNECSVCHTDAAGKVLGVKTRHLNSDFFYAATGRTANQLVTLNRLGFFSPAINEAQLPAMLTSKKQDDTTVSLERRARSYLDVNCAHCHQPAAPTQAAFDARLLTPPWFQNLINVTPGNSLGVSGARLVAPGSVDLSIVHRRAGSLAPGVAMPPVAKNLVDTAGMQLLTAWINSLDPAIGPTGSVTGTVPRDHSAPVLTLARTSGTGSVVTGAFSVTLSASETIRGLTLPDITVTNATLSGLTGSGAAWSFTVTPTAPGAVTLAIASDRVTDVNGNANNRTAPVTFTYQAGPVPGSLLTGGDFENGLTGWDNGGNVSVSTVAFRGTRAALVGNNTYLVRTIEVSELANYLFSGRVRAGVTGARAEAGLSFWDGNGVWIEDRVRTLQPGTTYEAFQIAFTAPVAARTVSVWILTGANGGVLVDDLAIVPGGSGDPRPVFGPGFTNLLTNGGFESGLTAWDTGGTATVSTVARSGTGAARLGSESFFVQSKAAVPGQKIAISGHYLSGGSSERIEAGFSFWDAAGNWITDRTLILTPSASYRGFVVDTVVPEGAVTMSIWGWSGAGGNATFDDLALFRPDQADENLFSNGGFEGGTLAPWDTGGTNVTLTAASRSGTGAALIGAESFLVHNRAVTAGEKLDFTGFARAGGNSTAPREAGISYWSASGAALGDELVPLVFSSSYTAFTVNGTAPAGAVACSVWVWSGPGGTLTIDDLRLVRPIALDGSSLTGVSGSAEQVELASRMANLNLKSGRTLDLSGNGTLQEDPLLAFAIGSTNAVYSDGWVSTDTVGRSTSGSAVARRLNFGETKSLVTTVNGPGLVTAVWGLETLPSLASLSLHVDGRELARWTGSGSRTVSARVTGGGLHTIEFRFAREGVSGMSGESLSATLDRFRFIPGFPHLQPDLILSGSRGRPVGEGYYQSNGLRQSLRETARGNKPAVFLIDWKNAAAEERDGATLHVIGGGRGYRTTYFGTGGSRPNLTSELTLGTYLTDEVAAGDGERFEARIRKAGRTRGSRYMAILRARSVLDSLKADGVRMEVSPR